MNRGLLTLMRRHRWNLTQEQRETLARYLDQFPVLKSLYFAKRRLNNLLLIKNLMPKHGKKFMGRLLKLIGQSAQSPARTLANTLTSWLEPIVRMWRTSKSNGVTEGFHTKMEMMSRRADGFRNSENYRLRVLAYLAERTGLEPATPGVTGRYSNQLNYRSKNLASPRGFEPRYSP